MGASGWDYYVPYRSDVQAALDELRRRVFETGDYWWAVPYEFGKTAADFPDRPRTEAELWASEDVQESGTHSILDTPTMADEDTEAGFGEIETVTAEEALEAAGTARPTRDHIEALKSLSGERWTGRSVVLHDPAGNPSEIYFWGASGD